jgi:nucleoside-diphosphate-sugar epimerase
MVLGAADGVVGRTLQLGSGSDVSIGELAELIGELLGQRLEIELDPQRIRPAASEVPRLLCDFTRTTELTGWEPKVDLRSGLAQTISWLASNQHRYRAREYAR